ncbi:FadR/GntR family transcriptional regulator [Jiangella mangrovi]|uniref:GntR family transcriptional repressor for pyruvate dehydrogenase complex n=1 Tax=Jiangella mangrovi TaxID=1524084 RepID=A0A7W9LJC4_9ACTN|nr:FCD domain-containing protein [Jiangella mangrovi]MBB5785879.1 GntR family transcriptional repressor for pyruvate dehydrogenase complex [Jiangella mangrovi]
MTTGEAGRRTLADELADGVVQLIRERRLDAGAQMDTVRSMADRFAVAVPTMREALRRLEAMGVVVLRHGSGVYVGENVRRSVLPNPHGPLLTSESLVDLLQARSTIEPPIAAMAATVRDADGVARITETLAEAEQCLVQRSDRLWMVNLDFHRAVAQASGNTVLAEVVDSIVLVHAQEQREILRLHGDEDEDFEEHRRIARAVLGGDADEAFRASKEHLDNVIEAIRARTPESGR